MAGVSLVILTGWGGHISLGQFAFVGIGAVVAGNLVEARVDLFFALIAAGAGRRRRRPGRRAAGAAHPGPVPRRHHAGVRRRPRLLVPQPDRARLAHADRACATRSCGSASTSAATTPCTCMSLAFLGLAILAALGVRAARSGRVVIATRDNQRAADAAAVPTTNVKLSAFLLSGTIAGVAGGFYMMAHRRASARTSSSRRSRSTCSPRR